MKFQDFLNTISKIEKMELPGEAFHIKMAPVERLLELKKIARAQKTARRAAVSVLFYPSKTLETRFVLILRKTYKGVHSAQIGFPGGKYEETDADFEATALRETEEEVGVPVQDIIVVKELTEIYIPPSNFFVQPYFCYCITTPKFIPQEEEVASIIEVDYDHFMDDDILTTKILTTSYATDIEVPAYIINDHVVWGATAMMLSEVREILQNLS